MATFDYSGLNTTAYNLLVKFGTTFTLTRAGSDATWTKGFDPIQQRDYWKNTSTAEIVYTEPTSTVVEDAGICVITNFETEDIDGTLIKQGDKRLIAKEIVAPQPGDVFVVGSISYRYVDHKSVEPDGNSIIYIIQVRV